ncbi:hypothetical protein [Pseudoalteromonas sp. KAN5]|uniref:hypothetical protein n=1 Tax=Pseudoalteromonas sp. KAN5 TaxID=2916633 RepID=UPI001FCC3682|nr:hypothetical protein [Pseudoalteromonas sp. KAN5]BDF96034.1 hypothetical protein KAN5_28720 [Pseudoalteromonas sp. KAN5]
MTLKAVAIYLVVSLCLSLHAWHSASSSLKQLLMTELPTLTDASLRNSLDEQQELNRISKQLVTTLQFVAVDNILPIKLIERLQVTQLQLLKVTERNSYDSALKWTFNGQKIAMQISTKADFKLVNIALVSLLLTFVFWQSQLVLNRLCTLISKDRDMTKHSNSIDAKNNLQHDCAAFKLLSSKTTLPADELKAICEKGDVKMLSTNQLHWFNIAINNDLSIESALTVAKQPDSLVFDLENQCVIIHGLHIRLAKTPLFYYYWYAQREVNHLPPYLNPPLNKPDMESAQQLSKLMSKYKGHQKAIRDLQEGGLKGKTLDQNRNKIKAELQKVLGELADEYLFISERDIKTARYKYRLNAQGKSITI